MPAATGTNTGCSSGCARLAATTPASATTEPSDKSTPPVRSTSVTPTARMPLIEIWRATLTRLVVVRNAGWAKDSAAQMTISAMGRPQVCMKLEKSDVAGHGGWFQVGMA